MVKSKKNKSKEGAVLEVQSEDNLKENIKLDLSLQEETKTTNQESEEKEIQSPENNDCLQDDTVLDNNDKQENIEITENQSEEKVKRSISLRKKFSFARKKKSKQNQEEEIKMNGNHNKEANGSVKRSQSLSEGKKESKIPLGKFRTLPFKKKHMSGSLDFESKNKVKDSGQDEWRMSGLLDTVAKSNSVASLNATSRSSVNETSPPIVALVPSPRKEEKPLESDDVENAQVECIIETVTEEEPGEDTAEETSSNTTEAFIKTDIDFEYSADIHDESVETPTTESVETPTTEVIEKTTEQVSKTATEEVTETTEQVLESEIKEKAISKDSTGSPKTIIITTVSEKPVVQEEDIYELCDDNITVTVRNLNEIAAEKQLEFPKEVIPNDWLVLNLSPITSC